MPWFLRFSALGRMALGLPGEGFSERSLLLGLEISGGRSGGRCSEVTGVYGGGAVGFYSTD